jgi:hypothetical protein
LTAAAALQAGVLATLVYHHEPWADEAQSWLIARDAGLMEIWSGILHYEGTPGLWHTLLYAAIRLGLPYSALNALTAALAWAASWLLLWRSPLPLAFRLTLPFTFFLCYQYAVVARSYSLLPLLLFATAIVYYKARTRPLLFTVLLVLTAAVSLHAVVLSASIWFARHLTVIREWRRLSPPERNRISAGALLYIAALAVISWSAWPAHDVTFVSQYHTSLDELRRAFIATFREAFTGRSVLSAAVVLCSLPLLYGGGGIILFVTAALMLCAVAALIYAQVWHHGTLFLAWLTAVWISAQTKKIGWLATVSLTTVIAIQCYWTYSSALYDLRHSYSGSRLAAGYLSESGIANKEIYGTGFAVTAVQPYFAANIFGNINGGSARAFWDWSARNRVNEGMWLFERRPEHFLAGYKSQRERDRWAALSTLANYSVTRHFEGNLFWRTETLEAESFDLYRRNSGVPSVLLSTIRVAEPRAARQLIFGFYDAESGRWRWTAKAFGVVLSLQDAAYTNGAKLVARLFIPEEHFARLGPITLSADIGGNALSPETYRSGGGHEYVRAIPGGLLPSLTAVRLSLDKASEPGVVDHRELGIVLESIGLEPF